MITGKVVSNINEGSSSKSIVDEVKSELTRLGANLRRAELNDYNSTSVSFYDVKDLEISNLKKNGYKHINSGNDDTITSYTNGVYRINMVSSNGYVEVIKIMKKFNESASINDSLMDTLMLCDGKYLDIVNRVDFNSNLSQVVTDMFDAVPYPSEITFTRKENSLATGVVTFTNEEGNKKYTVKFDVDGDAALYDLTKSLVMAQYRLLGYSDYTTDELYSRVHPPIMTNEAKELTKMEIPDGYEIVDKEYVGPVIDYECYIILCKKKLNDAFGTIQYVTWLLNDKGCHHGKYFWDLKAASKNFRDRVKEYKRNR